MEDRFTQLEKQLEATTENVEKAKLLSQLVDFAFLLNDWDRASGYLQQNIKIAHQLTDPTMHTQCLIRQAYCLLQLGDLSAAQSSALDGLVIAQDNHAQRQEAEANSMLVRIFLAKDEDAQAWEYLQRASQIIEEIGHPQAKVQTLCSQSKLMQRRGETEAALSNLKEALVLAGLIRAPLEQAECQLALADYYCTQNDYASALKHFEQFHKLKIGVLSSQIPGFLPSEEGNQASAAMSHDSMDLLMEKQALLEALEEQRQAVQSAQQENARLQREIVDRETLISDLNAFSHMVAHDLKNPLTALTGYSFLLSTRLRNTQDITILRYLEIIDQTSARMARIIDGLLLLASVRQQDVVPQKLDMSQIIGEVESRLELLAQQYQAKIVKPEQWPVVMGYGPWIEEVWSNYISNAIKYGGTPPVVELGSATLQNGKIRFWVHDNGEGLPPESIDGLFAAYNRLDRVNHIPAEGHGLGLSIVKRIVDKMNGEVSVESTNTPGEGCIFSFTLPSAPSTGTLSQSEGE